MQENRFIDFPRDGIELGQGWDSMRAVRKDAVGVVFVERRAARGQVKTADLEKASDQSRLMDAMEISTELQYAGLLGQASAKFRFASKVEVSSTSQCFVGRAKVENGRDYTAPAPEALEDEIAQLFDSGSSLGEVRELVPLAAATAEPPQPLDEEGAPAVAAAVPSRGGSVRLTPRALELARTDIERFHRVYGDSFVSAIHSGAELVAVLRFDARERKSIREIDSSVTGSGFGFTVSGAFKQTAESYAASNRLRIEYYQAGGSGDAIPTNLDGLEAKLGELPQLAQDAPQPFRITLQRYDTLPNWPGNPLPTRPSAYEQTIRRYFEYRSLYGDVLTVRRDPDAYLLGRGTDDARLRVVEGELVHGLAALERALEGFDRDEGDLGTLPPQASAPDYEFRIAMPIPRSYDDAVRWDMDGETLRRFITEFWIEAPSRNRCSLIGFSDPGCLSNEQIDDYARRIPVNHPVVVGGYFRASSKDSSKRWVEQGAWGARTDHSAHVADFRTWSQPYGESQGSLGFYVGFADAPGLIRGWREVVTSLDSTAPYVETVSWGERQGLREVAVANFRCWSAAYHEGHAYLYFYIDPDAAARDVVRGWRFEVTSRDSRAKYVRKASWGEPEGPNEVVVASFRTWSPEYHDGHGYLTFVLADG